MRTPPVSDVVKRFGCTVLPLPAIAPLDEALAFERMLTELSACFANISPERVDPEIENAQATLLEFLGFERSTFAQFLADGTFLVLSSMASNGAPPTPLGPFPSKYAWFIEKMLDGEVMMLESLPEALPPEAAAERELCKQTGLVSHLSIPLRIGGRVVGAIAFSAFSKCRTWPVELVARLKLIGDIFAQAIARKREHEKLLDALAEMQRLKMRLERENAYLKDVAQFRPPSGLIGKSPNFLNVIDEIRHVAPMNSTVLLLGETGTGKEVLAQFIHDASPRKDRPMVKVNCAALPASLIESELFGREKGAFTGALARQAGRFEVADGSTIFLDEIGELPLELQSKLLRVLQEGEFERLGSAKTIKTDARVIAATNRSLVDAVRDGKFREDLYYRLDVFPIQIPPLRDRKEDIALLTWTFVKEFSNSMGKPIYEIAEDAMETLLAYAWPGNIRELRNVIERAMILTKSSTLSIKLGNSQSRVVISNLTSTTIAEIERNHILQMLERCNWRIRGVQGAAELLGVKPTTLESRIKKLGLVANR